MDSKTDRTRHPLSRIEALWLALGLTGFAVAAPFYDVLLRTPDFLDAHHTSRGEVWLLTVSISIVLPIVIVAPGWLLRRFAPRLAQAWIVGAAVVLTALLAAQLLPRAMAPFLFVATTLLAGTACGIGLGFTRWKAVGGFLAILALFFPLRLLWVMPVTDPPPAQTETPIQLGGHLPDIVFLVLDELPVATLLDGKQDIDASKFPAFHRLSRLADWYVDTISVSDGTIDAVPAIVEGRYPSERKADGRRVIHNNNLFTILGAHYRLNVWEFVTRLCPPSMCSQGRGTVADRMFLLHSDLLAVFLHEVSPIAWNSYLPDVATNWVGFFAGDGFAGDGLAVARLRLQNAEQQTVADRPAIMREFTRSIEPSATPALHFLHVLLPHAPYAFLPGGLNYGLEPLRGKFDDVWMYHQWSIVSGRQRHVLQVQLIDELLGRLLDRLDALDMLESSLLVVVADHGVSFLPGDARRQLTDINAQSQLRVPLFIKKPGQNIGRRIEHAAMTIDILPTVLGQLGADLGALPLDGIDLKAAGSPAQRTRWANSYRDPVLREIDEKQLDVAAITREGRRQLKLDDSQSALWNIGPLDHLRGRPLDELCATVNKRLRYRIRPSRQLPDTAAGDFLPAFVFGRVSGRDLPHDSVPFVVTAGEQILASGMTWQRDENWFYYTLVQPRLVGDRGFSPRVMLVVDSECWAGEDGS